MKNYSRSQNYYRTLIKFAMTGKFIGIFSHNDVTFDARYKYRLNETGLFRLVKFLWEEIYRNI